MFCTCLHSAESHHADGCHALRTVKGVLTRCSCRRDRPAVELGPDHLGDALRRAADPPRRDPDKA
jgi:hypothetical protein